MGACEFDTSTPAVVLKFDPNVLHHGGLGVIRSLGRFGVPVYGVHERSLAPAAYSRYLVGRWVWRPPDFGEVGRVLDDLAGLARRIGRVSVLLATDDAAAIFLAEHGDPLREMFLFPDPPRELPRQVAERDTLYQLCQRMRIPCPESVVVGGWEQALAFADRVGFPVVGKRPRPWESEADVRGTEILRTDSDLWRFCHAGEGVLLQEYIPGANDWFFHGYRTVGSGCIPAFTGKKERSYPAHAGLTSLGHAVTNGPLLREATGLLAQCAFTGIVDLDFRWDARDRQYKLLDFNPRLGAQFRLFRDAAGIDVSLAAYLDLTGQTVSDSAGVLGRRFLVENYDPISALGGWWRGELGLRSWARSLRGVDETAWLAGDDMVPFALMCLWMGWRGASRVGRRAGRHRTRYTKGVRT